MTLYLFRHGDALAKSDDATRHLSPLGIAETKRMGAWLAAHDVPAPQRVLHSGLTRAAQTAQLLADACGWPAPAVAKNLTPDDDCEAWLDTLRTAKRSMALVGHMPFMGALTSALLCGDPGGMQVWFEKSGMAALTRVDDDGWRLLWFVAPALV